MKATMRRRRRCIRKASRLSQEGQEQWFKGLNFYGLGTVVLAQGDVTRATTLLHESLAIYRNSATKAARRL